MGGGPTGICARQPADAGHQGREKNGARRLPLHVVLKSEEGKVLAEGITPGPSDDMRKFLEVLLPDNISRGMLEFKLPDGTVRHEPVAHTEAPVQILNFFVSAP